MSSVNFALAGHTGSVESPRMLLVQFRTDTEAFKGTRAERSAAMQSALDLVIEHIGGLQSDAASLASVPGVSDRLLLDANGELIGRVTHALSTDAIPAPRYTGSPSFVRMAVDMNLLFEKRLALMQGDKELAWRLSCEEVSSRLSQFKAACDLHPDKAFQDSLAPGNGFVGRIETCDWRTPALVNYLHADSFSSTSLGCDDPSAVKPEAVFVSVRKADIDRALALLQTHSMLKEVSIDPVEFAFHSTTGDDLQARIAIRQLADGEPGIRLLLASNWTSLQFDLNLDASLKTDLTWLPPLDELQAHLVQQPAAQPVLDQGSPTP